MALVRWESRGGACGRWESGVLAAGGRGGGGKGGAGRGAPHASELRGGRRALLGQHRRWRVVLLGRCLLRRRRRRQIVVVTRMLLRRGRRRRLSR